MSSTRLDVPFALPDITDAEIEAVTEVLRSGWLTTGARCREFEQRFAAKVGASHAVAVNSCTAAMHLALDAVGTQRGDFVVTTPYTFAATAEVIQYFGAIPILVDVEADTLNMSVSELGRVMERLASGDRTVLPPGLRDVVPPQAPRAIMPVHIAGVPCDNDSIYALAEAYDAAVVEDAAHAFPASRAGRPVGGPSGRQVDSAVCFSFYATKTLTTGEGGMLVTESAELADRARCMSLHGIDHTAWNRYAKGGSWEYRIQAPGFKYNLTDIAAALGLVQLSRADEMLARRTKVAARYDEAFAPLSCFRTPTVPVGISSAWHLYMLRLTGDAVDRRRVLEEAQQRGVGVSVHFIPLHLHPHYVKTYGYERGDFPVAEAEYEREVSLPISSAMTDKEVAHVVEVITDIGLARR